MNNRINSFYVTEVDNVFGCKNIGELCLKMGNLLANDDNSVIEIQDVEAFDVPDVALSAEIS